MVHCLQRKVEICQQVEILFLNGQDEDTPSGTNRNVKHVSELLKWPQGLSDPIHRGYTLSYNHVHKVCSPLHL